MNRDHAFNRRANVLPRLARISAIGFAVSCGDAGAIDRVETAAVVSAVDVVSGAPPNDERVTRDAQIIDVLVTANTGEVEQGSTAQSKAQSQAVRDFAGMMVSDHSAANERLLSLAGRKGIQIESNAVSQELSREARSIADKLAPLSGAAFDRAYMDSQVSVHREVLAIIDDVLMPVVRDGDLKRLLVDIRKTVAGHLEHAEEIRGQLGGGLAATPHGAVGVFGAQDAARTFGRATLQGTEASTSVP
jgi:putative membrane protein